MTAELTGSKDPDWEPLPSCELDEAPLGQLHEFREDLTHAYENGAIVLDPTGLGAEEVPDKAINEQLIRALARRVFRAGRHFYLSPEYAWLGEEAIQKFSVLRTTGAETSAHGVFFGLLTDADDTHVIPVAVKPCRGRRETAQVDWLNGNLIAQTNWRHYKPVGLMIGEDTDYSITELEEGADTLDNTNWTMALADETDPDYVSQRAALQDIGKTIGKLHAQNIFHGDPQLKNVAIDVTGQVFFIDWESATFYKPGVHGQAQTKKAFRDLKVLFRSLAGSEEDKGVGLLDKFSPWMQWQHFKTYIFDPYMETFLTETGGEGSAFQQVAEIEAYMHDYVLEEGLAISFGRRRNGLIARQ